MVTPILRWAGSKRQHVPFLLRYWRAGSRHRYIEPFAGSAAVFFAAGPRRAVLGDLNGELIQAYRALRRHPQDVYRLLRRFPIGEAAYYDIRAARRDDPLWQAARFVYLNRFCFNGLYRTNLKGNFNVPYGAPKTDNLPSLEQFRSCARRLLRARLLHGDFRKTLDLVEAGDFVYIDPPYAVSRRRVFVEYGKDTFSTKDLDDLATWLDTIDERGATFVVSYAESHEARSLFNGWHRQRFTVRRNVAGFLGARRNHYELFISNAKDF